jgi:hypothetical protein
MSITIISAAADKITHDSFVVLRGVKAPGAMHLNEYFDASALHNPLNFSILKQCVREDVDINNEKFKCDFLRFMIGRVSETTMGESMIKDIIQYDKLEFFEQSIDNYIGTMLQNFTRMQDFNDFCIICMQLRLVNLDCDVTVIIGKKKVYDRLQLFGKTKKIKHVGGHDEQPAPICIMIFILIILVAIIYRNHSNYFFCNNTQPRLDAHKNIH